MSAARTFHGPLGLVGHRRTALERDVELPMTRLAASKTQQTDA